MNKELYNIEAEHAILGALIKNNNLIDSTQDIITPEYFYIKNHADIYTCIKDLILDGKSADPVSISNYFKSELWFKDLGGNKFVQYLKEESSNTVSIKTYCIIVKEKYEERILQEILQERLNELGGNDTKNLKDKLLTDVITLCESVDNKGGFASLDTSESVYEKSILAYNSKDPIKGLRTGFNKLDSLSSGLQGSKLYILGASTGCGKSALAFNIAYNVSKQNKKVAIFSLEMTREEVLERLITQHSGISQEMIQGGLYKTKDQMQKVKESEDYIRKLPIFVDEQSGLSISQVRSRAISLKRKHDIDLIIIDHMHLLKATGKDRLSQMGEISMGLKNISKELNVPVLSLAQLNRSFNGRANKRPILSDLRDSGTIEQDADLVMLLFREEYTITSDLSFGKHTDIYKNALTSLLENKGGTELMIAKNRGGKQSNIKMIFDGRHFDFIELNGLVQTKGLKPDDITMIEDRIVKMFGKEWITDDKFNYHQNKIIHLVKLGKTEEINIANLEMVNKYGSILECCSPILLGAMASYEKLI